MDSTQLLESDQPLLEDCGNRVLGILLVGNERHNITRGLLRIGRDPQCEIYVNNPTLSKIHATIDADYDGITVQDERSSNGTKKGRLSLKPGGKYILMNGDEFVMGNVVAKFELDHQEIDDTSSNGSETLLGDVEEDAENVPPNFVPETPVVVKNTRKEGRPTLPPETSFQPESQSSPLPSSAIAKLQVPESPPLDLNDSSFIAASQPQTISGNKLLMFLRIF